MGDGPGTNEYGELKNQVNEHVAELLREIEKEGKLDEEEEHELEDVMNLQKDLQEIFKEMDQVTRKRNADLESAAEKLENLREAIDDGPDSMFDPEKWESKQKKLLNGENGIKSLLKDVEQTESKIETLKQRAKDELESIFEDLGAVEEAESKAQRLTADAEAHLQKIEQEEDALITQIEAQAKQAK